MSDEVKVYYVYGKNWSLNDISGKEFDANYNTGLILKSDHDLTLRHIAKLENTIGHWQIKNDALQWDKVKIHIQELEQKLKELLEINRCFSGVEIKNLELEKENERLKEVEADLRVAFKLIKSSYDELESKLTKDFFTEKLPFKVGARVIYKSNPSLFIAAGSGYIVSIEIEIGTFTGLICVIGDDTGRIYFTLTGHFSIDDTEKEPDLQVIENL